jgi:glycosyltransferase involved in cell wall biosynthesis
MRIERIVVTGDVFRTNGGDPNQLKNVRWLRSELSRLYDLTGLCPEIGYRRNAADGGRAVIAEWYRLLGHAPSMEAWAATYGQVAPPDLIEAVRPDYDRALVIGFELSPFMRSILDAIGAPWVDVEVSPIRFLEDLALRMRFSWSVQIAHRGLVSPAHVSAAVERLRTRCAHDASTADLGGACVFLAQTRRDRTLIKDGAFFPDAEAVERVGRALGGRRLVLKPHPLAPQNPLLASLAQRFGAATTDVNIYALLATGRDVRFLTISSSAAIEARHFGHTPEVFHGSAHADAPGCASLWAHRSSAFWRAALAPILPLAAGADYEERVTADRLRRTLGAWGWPPPDGSAAPLSATVATSPAADPRQRSRPGVIILAPPWPRGGSSHLFAAQAAAHVRRGARVLIMLTPLDRSHRPDRTDFWADAVAGMAFPGVEAVVYPRAEPGRLRPYCAWLLAGRDDLIAITARHAACGQLPRGFAEFVASGSIDLIHANHAFSMGLARRLARIVERAHGRRPHILLETHDVQSDAVVAKGRRNPHSHGLDAHADLQRTELALSARADTLVHLTQADCAFFARRLPGKRHALILPTLDPKGEAELVRRRGMHEPCGFDFLYAGKNHEANLATVRWLLRDVLSLLSPAVGRRIRIVGSIGDFLNMHDPALFMRYRHLFVGQLPSIFDFYAGAKAVLTPAIAGTGTSVKLVEALCVGKPILATSRALRGLPDGETARADIRVHDSAADFAAAMMRLSAAAAPMPAARLANAALYDRLFSNARYFAALDDVLDGVAGPAPARAAKPRVRTSFLQASQFAR